MDARSRGRRPTGVRGVARLEQPKGPGAVRRFFGNLFRERRVEEAHGPAASQTPRPETDRYGILEDRIRDAADNYTHLKVVRQGKRICVLGTSDDRVHLDINNGSCTAYSDYGRIVGVRAGIGSLVPSVIEAMSAQSDDFRKLIENRIIGYDTPTGMFLVHIVYRNNASGVRESLKEPYRSFYKVGVAIDNRDPDNGKVARIIETHFQSLGITPVKDVLVTIAREPVLSIAIVRVQRQVIGKDSQPEIDPETQRPKTETELYVSVHKEPSYDADTVAGQDDDARAGDTVFFIEQSLIKLVSQNIIDLELEELLEELDGMNIKRLYLLKTNVRQSDPIRRAIDVCDTLRLIKRLTGDEGLREDGTVYLDDLPRPVSTEEPSLE